jgi:ribose transport system substrate-binding protein
MSLRRRRTTVAGFVGLTMILPIIAACSSGGSSSGTTTNAATQQASSASASSCVKQATAAVSSSTQVPGFSMPTDVSASPLKGKLVVAVAEDESIPDDVTWIGGIKQAAAIIGAHVQVIDGQGTPTGESAAIQQAINLHPGAILIWGVTESSVSGAISALKSSNIPWDNVYDSTGNGSYVVSINWDAVGKLEADYVLSQTNCQANTVVFTSSVFTVSIVPEVNAYKQEITAKCPSCRTTVIDVDPTKIATGIQPDAVAAVQRDPSVNYFLAGYDGEASYIISGIQQIGKKIPVIGNTGTSVNVDNVASGTPQVADVEHAPVPELAFMSFDDALRQLAHQPAAAQWYPLPDVLITPTNVKQAESYLSSTAYVSDFTKLWGLG